MKNIFICLIIITFIYIYFIYNISSLDYTFENNKYIYNCFESNYLLSIIYIFVISIIIFIYNKNKWIGIVISILLLFVNCFLPYTKGYLPLTMIKIFLIIFGSFLLFSSLLITCIQSYINIILTNIVRLNIFILLFTTSNLFLILSLLFLTITTPIFTIKNNMVEMSNTIIPKNIWVILTTIILTIYYLSNPYFCNNIYFAIIASIKDLFLMLNEYFRSIPFSSQLT